MAEWINTSILVLASASLALWIVIVRRRARGETIVAWQPRRPVPWLGWGAVPGVALTAAAVAASLTGEPPSMEGVADTTDWELISTALTTALFYLALLALAITLLVQACGATLHDLGWPASRKQLLSDIGLGLLTALAALAPVYTVQALAVSAFGDRSHPILDMMFADPRPLVLLVSALAAVVVAPVMEEVLYRLMLQGALERWEWLSSQPEVSDEFAAQPTPVFEGVGEEEALLDTEAPAAEVELVAPPFAGFGWRSIAVSSVLFALAHAAQWPSPIALVVLAAMLGFVYQRTHRIVPSIVAHAAFNGLSIALAIASTALEQPQ